MSDGFKKESYILGMIICSFSAGWIANGFHANADSRGCAMELHLNGADASWAGRGFRYMSAADISEKMGVPGKRLILEGFSETEDGIRAEFRDAENYPGEFLQACGWNDPILDHLDDDEFTDLAYRVVLGRKPDPQAMRVGVGQTRYSILGGLIDSPEFRQNRLPKLGFGHYR